MRFVVVKKDNSAPEVVVWPKSQYQVTIRQGVTRQCSHREYLDNNNIPYENAISVGNVSYNPATGQSNVEFLPWNSPDKKDDAFLIQKATVSFYKNHPELKNEIQEDWNAYVEWLRRREELLGNRK